MATCSFFLSVLANLCFISFLLIVMSFRFKKPLRYYARKPYIEGDVYHSAKDFRTDYAQMRSQFKIYVHTDGGKYVYNKTVTAMQASESYFFNNIRESSFLTNNPDRANLFIIPVPCKEIHEKIRWCDMDSGKFQNEGYFDKNMKSSLMKDHQYRAARVLYIPLSCYTMDQKETILVRYEEDLFVPLWNASEGSIPLFLICHEFEHKAIEELPLLPQNSIRLVCSRRYRYNHRLIPYIDISLPAVMLTSEEPVAGHIIDMRMILGYWEGICDTDISETLVELWEDDHELDVQCTDGYNKDGRPEKLSTARFCICPGATSKCVTMAIHYGCVPVILADYYNLPFNQVLNWRKFSIILEESEVYHLKGILEAKAGAKFRKLYYNVLNVQKHFRWNTSPRKYDAFHMTLYELWSEENRCRIPRYLVTKPSNAGDRMTIPQFF